MAVAGEPGGSSDGVNRSLPFGILESGGSQHSM